MNKKIECIRKLVDNDMFYEFIDWFKEQKLIDKGETDMLDRAKERAEFVYTVFLRAEEAEQVQLVDYEWTLLPLETIKILCITENEKKEFTYGL